MEDREIPIGGDPAAEDPHERGCLVYVSEIAGKLAWEQVFGAAGAGAREAGAGIAADRIESAPAGAVPRDLFAGIQSEAAAPPAIPGRRRGRRRQPEPDESLETHPEATTPDRVHSAVLLQASRQGKALRVLLAAQLRRRPDFPQLANAQAVLDPKGSKEKGLVEAMLLAVPR